MENKQLALNIKRLCQQNGITLGKLSEDLNLPRSFISDMSTKEKTPSIKRVEMIANYFHVSIDYLVGRETTQRTIIDNSIGKEGDYYIGNQIRNVNKSDDDHLVQAVTEEAKKLSKAELLELLSKMIQEE